jgi:hypothetical protein
LIYQVAITSPKANTQQTKQPEKSDAEVDTTKSRQTNTNKEVNTTTTPTSSVTLPTPAQSYAVPKSVTPSSVKFTQSPQNTNVLPNYKSNITPYSGQYSQQVPSSQPTQPTQPTRASSFSNTARQQTQQANKELMQQQARLQRNQAYKNKLQQAKLNRDRDRLASGTNESV